MWKGRHMLHLITAGICRPTAKQSRAPQHQHDMCMVHTPNRVLVNIKHGKPVQLAGGPDLC